MKYKGIIFDLDGVICSTDDYHYEAWQKAADSLGIYFDKVINNRLRGVSRAESLEIILERHDGTMSEEKKQEVLKYKNDIYLELLQGMSEKDLDPKVKSTLETLKAKGLKLTIGSSSKNARPILNKLGLGEFFHDISDGTMIQRSKPHPEVFLIAASLVGLTPQENLVIEDAHAGVEAAHAGGFDCAAIGDAIDNPLAKFKLNEFSDILKIIE
ncbi:MAG: beta-phosphoglucomutase [Firmicutes bacterium]|nr:beta-phosphoglucomutase [Bacillota bacterium]MCL2256478.1 beta-phosphoglucomutase [Bacillota bacterium]